MREHRGRLLLVAVLILVAGYVESRTDEIIARTPPVAVQRQAVPQIDPTVALLTGRPSAVQNPAPAAQPSRKRVWLAFACGIFLGGPLAVVILALCASAKRADEDMARMAPWQGGR